MNFQKTLAQLGVEYEQAARILTERIRAARKRLNLLENNRLGKEAYAIKSELKTLYGERREALETAAVLCSYYDKNEGRKTA